MPTKRKTLTPIVRSATPLSARIITVIDKDYFDDVFDYETEESVDVEIILDLVKKETLNFSIAPLVGTCSCVELINLPRKTDTESSYLEEMLTDFILTVQNLMIAVEGLKPGREKSINFIMTLDDSQKQFMEKVIETGMFGLVKTYRSLNTGKVCHLLVSTN